MRAVVDLWRGGSPAEEITLAQVFDALSDYSDHTAEINEHIEANRLSEPLG